MQASMHALSIKQHSTGSRWNLPPDYGVLPMAHMTPEQQSFSASATCSIKAGQSLNALRFA
eukprot:CAMPEP_0206263496 /NCGR_PEP_ID=MMETSP0047_2-20121206/28855_1 /ASSEMBLY_ACC=CAM_ASM_000192 /TAXON_ID=195065 /ORGANISM="Chroomonas mesostigmatica_cf, Strain CCMP1168" /LENGTH=60 /DNA_ID=CAMNT_0053691053 /DNA_START=29 /DNA_END=207 /DNA_ORIENTATION=-